MNVTFLRLEVGAMALLDHDGKQHVLVYDWYYQPDPVCKPAWIEVKPPDGCGLGGTQGRGVHNGTVFRYWLPVVSVRSEEQCVEWLDDASTKLGTSEGHMIVFLRPPGQFGLAWSDTAFPLRDNFYQKTSQPRWWRFRPGHVPKVGAAPPN
jgi:hypothetical protein